MQSRIAAIELYLFSAASGRYLGLLKDLANFGLAIAGDFQKALRQFDRFLLRVRRDQGKSANDLFRFREGAVSDGNFSAGAAYARAKSARKAAFGREQPAGLKAVVDQLPHFADHLLRGRRSFGFAGLVDAQEFHGRSPFRFAFFTERLSDRLAANSAFT